MDTKDYLQSANTAVASFAQFHTLGLAYVHLPVVQSSRGAWKGIIKDGPNKWLF
jgi:hypothetical protein